MADRRIIRRGSFFGKSDDGQKFEIFIFQEMPDVSVDPVPGEIAGIPFFQTRDGKPVNRTGKGIYQIVETGLVVRSDAPVAQ